MTLFSGRLARPLPRAPLRLVTVLALSIAATAVLPTPAHAATATLRKTSEWSTGYAAEMTVRNTGGTTATSWRVSFDLPAGTSVGAYWNATMTRAGSRYVFSNVHWNGRLAPGAQTSFGWVSAGTDEPINCLVDDLPCDGAGQDVTPPSTPTNVQGGYARMTWDAATDDRGVVAYELMDGTNVRAVVAGTSYTYTGPPPPPRVYHLGVRAVDAAGNRSPVAALPDGRPDTDPPAMPANLAMSGTSGGYFAVRWTTLYSTQIVAGYEVYLNGVLIRKVGGTTAYVPYSGFGVYIVRVRAYDPAGNFSPFAQVGIAVDPPPPVP